MNRAAPVRILMLALALLSGCAHRAAPAARDPGEWRSREGFGAARWGMTPAELQPALAGAEKLDPSTFRVRDRVDDKPAVITYAFPYGHLASVTVALDTDIATSADFDERFRALAEQYGPPRPPPGSEDEAERDAVAAAIITVALIAGLILCAVATKGAGAKAIGGVGAHAAGAAVRAVPPAGIVRPVSAAWWVGADTLRLAADGAQVAVVAASQPPPGTVVAGGWIAEWHTSDTDVVLTGSDLGAPGGTVVESLRSAQLAPAPAP